MTKVLVLKQSDITYNRPDGSISIENFKFSTRLLFGSHDLVIFMKNDGTSALLKNERGLIISHL